MSDNQFPSRYCCHTQYISIHHGERGRQLELFVTKCCPWFPIIFIARTQYVAIGKAFCASLNACLSQEARNEGESLVVLHWLTSFVAVNVVPVTDPFVVFSVFSKSSRQFPAYKHVTSYQIKKIFAMYNYAMLSLVLCGYNCKTCWLFTHCRSHKPDLSLSYSLSNRKISGESSTPPWVLNGYYLIAFEPWIVIFILHFTIWDFPKNMKRIVRKIVFLPLFVGMLELCFVEIKVIQYHSAIDI